MRAGPADIFYYRPCRSICASRNIEGALVYVLNLARLFRNEIDPKISLYDRREGTCGIQLTTDLKFVYARVNVQKWRCVHFNHRLLIENDGEFRRFLPTLDSFACR